MLADIARVVTNWPVLEMGGDIFHVLALGTLSCVALGVLPGLGRDQGHDLVGAMVRTFRDVQIDHRSHGIVASRQMPHEVVLGRSPRPVHLVQVSPNNSCISSVSMVVLYPLRDRVPKCHRLRGWPEQ